MDEDKRMATVDLICDYPLHIGQPNTEEEKSNIRMEFDNYQVWARRLRTKFPASYEQFENGKRSMLNYFLTNGGDKWPLLKDLAIRVFSLISSSACVERANSTMGFIHSKLRSKLGKEKIIKLCYIKSNTKEVMKEIDFDVLREIAEEEVSENVESENSDISFEQEIFEESN